MDNTLKAAVVVDLDVPSPVEASSFRGATY